MQELLIQYGSLFTMIHIFSVVIGLGGATYSDILLMKFLRDFHMSKKEVEVIETMSKVIQVGLLLAVISGAVLFYINMTTLMDSGKFLTKMCIMLILMVNGMLLHKYILPDMFSISYTKKRTSRHRKLLSFRRVAFCMGGVSFVSWYSVFILGSFRFIDYSFQVLFGIYLILLIFALIGAFCMEMYLENKYIDQKNTT